MSEAHTNATMVALPPSVLMKQAFRKALRSHPQGMRGAQVSAMSVDELRDALVALGVDTDATLAAYAARVGQSLSDQDQDQGDSDQGDSTPAADPAAVDPVDQELA